MKRKVYLLLKDGWLCTAQAFMTYEAAREVVETDESAMDAAIVCFIETTCDS